MIAREFRIGNYEYVIAYDTKREYYFDNNGYITCYIIKYYEKMENQKLKLIDEIHSHNKIVLKDKNYLGSWIENIIKKRLDNN